MHSDGSFDFTGRQDFVINSGGIKISPEWVEIEVKKHFPQIKNCLVVGRPESKLGQVLTLLLEEKHNIEISDLNAINSLPEHCIPKAIEKIRSFKFRSLDKIDRLHYGT
jgi:O-succinylbenzoic acid--CoA ligase